MLQWIKELVGMWFQYRLTRQKAALDSKNQPYAMIAKQTEVLQTWMESFRVHEIPTATVTRQEDEFTAEEDREYEKLYGIPPTVSQSIRNGVKAGAFPELKDIFDQE